MGRITMCATLATHIHYVIDPSDPIAEYVVKLVTMAARALRSSGVEQIFTNY